MKDLKERILEDGKVYPNNVLKVDSFLNHQVDPELMDLIANNFARQFKDEHITKVITIEASGIAPALFTAKKLFVPMLFAKKTEPSTLQKDDVYSAIVHSYTKDTDNRIIIGRDYLSSSDRVLIVDDFLANGEAASGLINICHQAEAEVAGVAICIEKSFQPGRKRLEDQQIPVYSEARIASLDDGTITFAEGH